MPHSEGLPPEINSGNIWNGPGAGSLVTAYAQWEMLGREARSLECSLDQMLGCLMEEWSGEVAMQVNNAATPFLDWLANFSDQVTNAARQTQRILIAFCNAHNEVVPPEAIDANRAEMLALINDNELGQNTAAIVALEDEYGRYWDQDGVAMNRYRWGLSTALTNLKTPWQQPPPIANNTGLVPPVPLSTAPPESLSPMPPEPFRTT
ncbi:PPE family protein [Mycobacterium haemophilum DSM 44634]|uniref:PPE family protein n=1 Tax=Mycobacterium haemophilum TaxID=29311 RepID=UPI0006427EAB|nr:PPE family protein [Mycobacterium haemophilum]AKN16043.1 hypothetical protein B586_04820 [Mycobacterium haemophilum DSM 44634]KLO46211.1 hypothetical protein ABH36_18550 [Mycobacterium haemophilum]MCV7341340.1 PPE family protein [Mycobacterium haemophilum DSM 44634]